MTQNWRNLSIYSLDYSSGEALWNLSKFALIFDQYRGNPWPGFCWSQTLVVKWPFTDQNLEGKVTYTANTLTKSQVSPVPYFRLVFWQLFWQHRTVNLYCYIQFKLTSKYTMQWERNNRYIALKNWLNSTLISWAKVEQKISPQILTNKP